MGKRARMGTGGYSITTNQAAIIALFRAVNHNVGNLPPMPGDIRNEGDHLAQ